MKHFVLPVPPNPDGMVRLYEKDHHYLVRVRRLKPGMCFEAVLPGGAAVTVRILSTVDGILIGECLGAAAEKRPEPHLPPVALFQGLPKGAKMDIIVRQAAEGGVSVVVPFASENSTTCISRTGRAEKEVSEKQRRWERIVREARQQSGSAIETEIRPPCGFEEILAYWESIKKEYRRPVGLLLHQEPLEKGTFHDYLGSRPDFAALAVGPEGGFSSREVSLFLAAGWKPVLMGNTILRTETAALYGAAVMRILLLESEAWVSSRKE